MSNLFQDICSHQNDEFYLLPEALRIPSDQLPPELTLLLKTQSPEQRARHLMLKYQSCILRQDGLNSLINLPVHPKYPFIHSFEFKTLFLWIQKTIICFLWYLLHMYYVPFQMALKNPEKTPFVNHQTQESSS